MGGSDCCRCPGRAGRDAAFRNFHDFLEARRYPGCGGPEQPENRGCGRFFAGKNGAGTVALKQKWEQPGEIADPHLDDDFSGENGKLRVCTSGTWYPMSYFAGSELTGEFIEIVKGFCKAYGYEPVFECCNYAAGLAGMNTAASSPQSPYGGGSVPDRRGRRSFCC